MDEGGNYLIMSNTQWDEVVKWCLHSPDNEKLHKLSHKSAGWVRFIDKFGRSYFVKEHMTLVQAMAIVAEVREANAER